MRNIFKKGLFIVLGCLMASAVWGTSIADLNFQITSTTTAVPSNYTYSTANTPGIKTQNSIKCVIISDGGGSTAPTFNGTSAPSGGKRWMAFSPDVDCSVTIGIMSNKKKFYIQNKDGEFFAYTNTANAVEEQTVTGLKAGEWYAMCGASSQVYVTHMTFTAAGPSVSTDATLSSLTYNGTSVPNFAATTLSYDVELPAGTTAVPTVAAVKHDTKASDPVITQASALPGTATVVVTAEDGTTTKTYTVNFTVASSAPKVTSATWANIKGSATIDQVNKTITGQVTHGSSLTAITPTFNGTNIDHYTPTGAQNFSAPVNYVFFSSSTESTQYTVTITEAEDEPVVPVPTTDLTLHQPEVYEAPTLAGGYNTPLTIVDGREYEVYYAGRMDDGGTKLTIHTKPVDKSKGITKNESNTSYEAIDGWFQGTGTDKGTGFAAKEEFTQASVRCHTVASSNTIEMHFKGYDQFSLYAADKKWTPSKPKDCKYFKVSIDDVEQTMTASTDQTIRRFNISTAEHVVKITLVGDGNLFGGFSLRVAQEPRTKYLEGNDSTQVVYQTQEPDPVYYYTKYGHITGAQTKLEWVGSQANGITLQPGGQDALGDTLVLGGTANCQTGTYTYNVVSYYNNVETNRVSGKLNVATYIRSTSRDTVFEAFTNEPMDEITYQYLALSADSVHLVWKTTAPAGISGQGSTTGTKYIISGTPIAAGTYDYTVKIGGGNSLNGRIVVKSIDTGTDPILYLYKNSLAYENDGVYQYLTSSAGGSNNLIPRKASENGPRTDYNKYKWILISEDVDADNAEVMAIVRDNAAKLPVLNMKGFTYAKGRLNWGEPNNGTIDSTTNNGCYIYVQQSTHPIFNGFTLNQNGALQVLNKVNKKGVMPIDINNCAGTLCLATAYTRNIDDYDKDGELQTIIHEVPVGVNGKTKHYICFPLANTKDNLTDNGKKLLKNIVSYLKGTSHFTNMPELEITSFSVAGFTAKINQAENLIELELTKEQFEQADSLKAVKPEIAVKDSKTHVVPSADEELDLRYATFMPASFVVTDYINRCAYSFKISLKKPEGLEDIYEAGEWVNIFDIYGRKIATTNEDIYTMELPRGMYIIVTEKGQSIKLMK